MNKKEMIKFIKKTTLNYKLSLSYSDLLKIYRDLKQYKDDNFHSKLEDYLIGFQPKKIKIKTNNNQIRKSCQVLSDEIKKLRESKIYGKEKIIALRKAYKNLVKVINNLDEIN